MGNTHPFIGFTSLYIPEDEVEAAGAGAAAEDDIEAAGVGAAAEADGMGIDIIQKLGLEPPLQLFCLHIKWSLKMENLVVSLT